MTVAGLLLTLAAGTARASTFYYWDPQGTTGTPTSGTWETSDWSTSSSGQHPTVAWTESFPAEFAARGTSSSTFTVTMNSNHTVAGYFDGLNGTDPCTATVSGSGTATISGSQGFYVYSGASLTINNVIAGSGEVVLEDGGSLTLSGANTYSGGVEIGFPGGTAFTGTFNFGNNTAFGSGAILMTTSGTGATLAAVGSGAYTIANAVDMANITLHLNSTPAGVTFSGPWDTGSGGPCTLYLGSAANDITTISGQITDIEGFVVSGTGTLILSGNNNTYGTTAPPNGSTVVSGTTLLLANTSGSATGSSAIVITNTASTLTGNGTASGNVANSGNISATNASGGTATLTTGGQTWGIDSAYQWAINNATGTAGAASGWDELVINGGLTNSANSTYPLTINIISLTSANVQGALSTFNNAQDYSWLVIHSTNPVVPVVGFSSSTVAINSSLFANALSNGVFSVSTNNTPSGGDVFVNFVHTPVLSVSNVTVNAGSNAVFFASNSVPNSTPATATWSWKSNSVALSDGGRISGSATPSLTIANAQSTDDATYTVVGANAAGEDIVSATLTVIPAGTSVTWSNPAPIVYGTALDTNELNASANVAGSFVYTPPAGTVLNIGTYTLTAVFTPSNNVLYTNATNMVPLTVSAAPLTITASNATRPYGQANPAFTGSIIGAVNNDNFSETFNCSATSGSPAGSYLIVPVLVDPQNRATNYIVTVDDGTLDVGSIITWSNQAITYGTPLSSAQLDATADVPGNFVYNPAAGAELATGTYPLTATFTPNDNVDYNTTNVMVNVVVSPVPLTVTASNVTRQAGVPNPTFTGSVVGLQYSDNITATYACSATSASPAGTYSIVPSLVDPQDEETNYTVTLNDGVLTVTAPPAPLTAPTPSIIPLPVVLSNRPGVFALCPSQPANAAPAQALMQILVDASSQQTGQFLAASLFKSTGYRFNVSVSTATNAVKNAILITTSNAIASLATEGYELTVAPDSAVIRAPGQSGTFYGMESLLQLLPPQIYSQTIVTNVAWIAPCVYIEDYPTYPWRGVMLDVARHFFNKQEVKQVLDAMAMHKLNTFHWHLTDDQGWRFQVTNYPSLTGPAGSTTACWRNGSGQGTGGGIDYGLPPRSTTATNSLGYYGGYYTQADCAEVVAYAAQRHITIVPEIEIPCHADAALGVLGQFTCGDSGDYTMDYYGIQNLYGKDLFSIGSPGFISFIEDVLTEVMGVFPGKYIHLGGDEVQSSGDDQWPTYSADETNYEAIFHTSSFPNTDAAILDYQYWLSTNLASFLQAHGRMMVGWSDFDTSSLGVIPNAVCMDYGSEGATAAKAGALVVESPSSTVGCYINYIEGSSASLPIEPPFVVGGTPSYLTLANVYAFNPIPSGLSSQYTNNILGAQCNLWGEYVPSFRNVMFKMFPRETAMSEVTWTPHSQQIYSSFTNRLAVQEQRFTAMGLNYDHETIPQIGTWGPTVSASPTTLFFNVTTNITAAGEVDVSFWDTGGTGSLAITSVALLQNGVQVDIDVHNGSATTSNYQAGSEPFIPLYTLYVLHLPETKPGATYTIQAVVQSSGSTSTSGTVYMPNWD